MKESGLDEKVIANQIRNGDLHAFATLYETHHRLLFHFARKFLKSTALAEDIVHDVFLKFWESRAFINPDLPVRPYLIKICKSQVLNLLVRAGREKEIMQEIGQSMRFEHNDTEETVQGDNLSILIEQIVSQLPTQRQRIFRMYRLEGLGLNDIADQLGISKGTVKDHIFKAGSFVRKCLSTQADIPLSLLFLLSSSLS